MREAARFFCIGRPVLTRKLRLVIEYDGIRYSGWQLQTNGTTIQGVLQNCLTRITGEENAVVASGRTDAGVHAEGQVAHFRTESTMTPTEFLMAFNSLLPQDIVIKSVTDMPDDFHAQMSAVRKVYRYTILNRDHPSALCAGRCLYIQTPLDLKAMDEAKRHFLGELDFSAVRASNCEAKSPVRTLYRIDIEKRGDFIDLYFEGDGFLKHMVRNIVGTLVLVGRGKMTPERVGEIMCSKDRKLAGPTAQPQGLCLVKVLYEDD